MNDYEVQDETTFIKKNMTNFDISNINQINGAPYLSIISAPYFNATIFLFGDWHKFTKTGFGGNVNRSIYLPLYLDALFKKYPNKQFDLITETKYTKNEIYTLHNSKSGVIINTIKQFFSCYETLYDKTKCKAEYPNLRVHFGDIRGLSMANENLSSSSDEIQSSKINNMRKIGEKLKSWFDYKNENMLEFSNMLQKCTNLDVGSRSNCYSSLLLKIKQRLGEFQPGQYGEFIFSLLESDDSKFIRYRKIEGYAELRRYIIHELDLVNFCFSPREKIDKIMARKKNPTIAEFRNIIKDFKHMFRSTGVIMFDYYALIRFLKIKEYGNENNIIMLAGEAHTKSVLSFIKYIDENNMMIFSNLKRIKIENLSQFVIDSYKTMFKDDIFVLEIHTINENYLRYYLEKLRRNLIELEDKNKQANKLLLNIDNLIKICKVSSYSKYNVVDDNKCVLNLKELDNQHGFRYVSIESSEIEGALYVNIE